MPQSLVLAVGAGIGLFIASVRMPPPFMLTVAHLYIDLSDYVRSLHYSNLNVKPTSKSTIQASGGLGVIGGNTTNFVGLGGCLPESK